MTPTNPLERAIKSAEKANEVIRDSFARYGMAAHPRGFVLTAYRNANRAMKTALQEQNALAAAMDVMSGLRASVRNGSRSELTDMAAFGFEEANRQLRFYSVDFIEQSPVVFADRVEAAVDAVVAKVTAQEAAIRALILTNADQAEIIGDDDRQGVLRAADVLAAGTYWTAALVWSAFSWLIDNQSGKDQFKKQAIAGLDGRTTDCCLRVHSQVQPLNGAFHLTGTPRYADNMDWSPFHKYCRTSIALYMPEFDDGLTEKMRAGADKILAERAAGGSGSRHPADAYG